MNDNPTREELLKSIEAKSDQLNADDLIAGPITVEIENVSRGDNDQPIVVGIKGQRPYKPCKTMRRVLIATFGDDPKNWVGQRMTLYNDPNVMWAGVKVGGIRISHLSGLDEPRTFVLTQTRGKKSEVTIRPIKDTLSDADKAYIQQVQADIRESDTLETLKAVAFVLKQKPKTIRDALRPAYEERQRELSQETKNDDDQRPD